MSRIKLLSLIAVVALVATGCLLKPAELQIAVEPNPITISKGDTELRGSIILSTTGGNVFVQSATVSITYQEGNSSVSKSSSIIVKEIISSEKFKIDFTLDINYDDIIGKEIDKLYVSVSGDREVIASFDIAVEEMKDGSDDD